MKSANLLLLAIMLLFLFACRPEQPITKPGAETPPQAVPPAASKQKWEEEWEKMLALGRKEGKVVLYSSAGNVLRQTYMEAFPVKTGIALEMTIGKSASLTEKVLSERRNGLYLQDLFQSGLTSLIALKGAGALEPIEPVLILPENLDTKLWFNNELPFTDKDRKLFASYNARPGARSLLVNTEHVKKGEIAVYTDLLKPQYKGKILINDPTISGSGSAWFAVAVETGKPGLEFMKALAKQEPVLSRDERQQVDWVARGKYYIGIGLDDEIISEYIAAGAALFPFRPKDEASYITSGGANVVLLAKAPHPNAARVFINWLLSREGQNLNSRIEKQQSRRLDVPTSHISPDSLREPNKEYFPGHREEWHTRRAEFFELARQVFVAEK